MTERGIEFETVDYIKESSLTEAELNSLLRTAGLKPQDAIRKNEPAYQQYVANKTLTDDQVIGVMIKHPELIQRPIVTRGTKAVLARPSENLTKLGIK